ncbi:MAG: UDP-N-acetylglucosamine 2-epimerase (non-hydrolyzing) [Candidatus Kapabacteria bacterium]|nr:UDP-N-acetylglucosamine 2-epimerase (non-hydrolyzing) [Candidatus Kapabacteria bacterium]
MKKIISIVGARPNFMKVAPIDKALQKYDSIIEHKIVHTGQHYDKMMSDSFFDDLDMPQPAHFLGVGSGSHAEQTARVIIEFEKVCLLEKPDLVLVVGDVNSTVAASLTSVKLGIPTAHIEAGLRSFDRSMPEEINRIATDSICDYCFVTEQSGLRHLAWEGFNSKNIFFVGNTMIDSQFYAMDKAKDSDVLKEFNLKKEKYILVTLHRPSNVDESQQIEEFLDIFSQFSSERKIVFPIHPRTRKNLELFGLSEKANQIKNLILCDPQPYIRFLSLMMNADFVVTDSGGIQEETTALSIPCLTLRTTTERPVTCEIGTNRLIIPEKDRIIAAFNDYLAYKRPSGTVPPLWDGKAAERIVDIILNKILKIR